MFPTCPACKQSVLDDDATECPFCGANMKTGKGGSAKPASPPKAAPKPASAAPAAPAAASKPAASAGAGKSSSGSGRKSSILDDDDDPFGDAEDDDPFTLATKEAAASKATAIPVSPKKTKLNVVEVHCKMCDTAGFIPETARGKDVKCCNPACRAPIFEAPKNLAPPIQVNPTPAKPVKKPGAPSKMPLILSIVGGVALVAIVGAAVYFWPEAKGPEQTDFGKLALKAQQEREKAGLPAPDLTPKEVIAGNDGNNKVAVNPAAEQLDVPGLLKLMQDRSLEEKLNNKKYCRQRTAIGFALAGDVEGMKSQFQALDEVESNVAHFKIPAYLTLGWAQFARGNKTGAATTADEAVAATVNIGKGSRETQDPVIDLAAFLIATGKLDIAQKLMAENLRADDSTPLAVATALSRHRRDYDLDHELPGNIGNPYKAWPEVGVTLILANEGLWAEAEQWANSIGDVEAKTDCLVAWADAKTIAALAQKQPVDSTVEAAAAKLPAGAQAQLLARLAITHAKANNNAEAERLITAAQAALKGVPVPEAAVATDFKQILDWKAPEAVPLHQATLGAAAIGLAQAQLKKLEEGGNSTLDALKYARGMAPSPTAASGLKAEADNEDIKVLREKVRKILALRSSDEAVRKTRELQNKLDDVEKRATSRFQLEEAVLLTAAEHGMAKQAWTEALSRAQRNEPNEHEPYLSGTLPAHFLYQFNKAGQAAEAAEVTSKVEQAQLQPDEVLELQQAVDSAIQNHNFAEAITAFNSHRLEGRAEEVALRAFVRQAKREGQALPTLTLTETLDARNYNQLLKMEAVRVVSAYASTKDDPTKVRTAVNNLKVSPLEKISGFLGILEGTLAGPKKAAPAAPAAAEPEKEPAEKPKKQ